ncbi:hypothetical protein C8T65DRAFT_197970 [Cerioporus squamosus]|nr:hypothetical protein C8T65DRAFT_197970 [Cerioporus squamosus]
MAAHGKSATSTVADEAHHDAMSSRIRMSAKVRDGDAGLEHAATLSKHAARGGSRVDGRARRAYPGLYVVEPPDDGGESVTGDEGRGRKRTRAGQGRSRPRSASSFSRADTQNQLTCTFGSRGCAKHHRLRSHRTHLTYATCDLRSSHSAT